MRVLRAAGTKATLEMIEIASVTHPVYAGAPAFSVSTEGKQHLHIAHLLALGALAHALFGREEEVPPEDDTIVVYPQQTVAFVAEAPGEYRVLTAPQTPQDIRRFAMRQRTLGQPQFAMLASSSDPRALVGVPQGGTTTATYSAYAATAMPAAAGAAAGASGAVAGYGHHGGCGCGCGGGGAHATPCRCGCSGGALRSFPPARYEDDGSCASVFSVSCETRWRIRECFKVAFCDLLRCASEELCEDGEIVDTGDPGKCIDRFVCSLLECLPEAICPPAEKDPCCPPVRSSACHCNFAVGE
jgi:hypothetical protein